MTNSCRTLLLRDLPALLFALMALSPPGVASAHGSVTADDDLCLIKIGYYSAHFKIYLPRSHGHKQFCEDLPAVGESLFVMEYAHDGLGNTPIEFRIIRNPTGQGRFTRLSHIEALHDLDAHTVFRHAPATQADVFTVLHEFSEAGEYVGIVSARAADGSTLHKAVFPFEAGFAGFGLWPWLALGGIFLQLNYLWMTGWFEQRSWRGLLPRAWFGALLTAAVLPLGSSDALADEPQGWLSDNGHYTLYFKSALQPIVINRIHSWTIVLQDSEGRAVNDANFAISGGMPAHDHGLPTNPRITRTPGEGRYLLEGLRFHMPGRWELQIVISAPAGRDTVTLTLDL